MAYKPTNNIQENIIHRNTIFDSQGMVSCCTCGNCIEKTEDASLTLTNFKAADPLVNENSIGSTVIDFSDYMIPTGSFEYVLTPYQTTDTFADGTNATNLKFADSLVYYPFLKCEGITTLKPNSIYDNFFIQGNNWPSPIDVNGVPTKTQKPYASEFANVSINVDQQANGGTQSNGIQQTPSPNAQYINNVYIYSNSNIYFDNQFGSYIANTFFGFSYNNTAFNQTFYNADYLYYFDENNVPIQSNFYRWGVLSNSPFGAQYYLSKNVAFIVKDSQFEFSTKYSFGTQSILNNGITPNLSRLIGQSYPYTVITPQQYFNFTSHIDIFDLSNFKDKNSYWLDGFGKRMDYINWISSGGSSPCNGTQLQNIAAGTAYNVTNYTTAKPYPSLVGLGDYQTYLSYVNTHEFSHLGFKSDAGCANNIVKLINPVYFKSFDNYSFSYTYPNYTKTNSVFGITDKFIIPDFQTWGDCLSYGYPATKTLPAKTVQLKEMNSTDNIYKGGYVLDKFQLNKDGTFNGTISITARNDFFATGLESVWNLETSSVYSGTENCTYLSNRWNNNVVSTTNQFNITSHAVFDQTLIQENEFIKATPTTYIDYYNQVETGFYTNGSFNDYSSGLPVTYYEDVCKGYIQQPNSVTTPLFLPTSYVAQKTDRTKITSTTDASGKTTTTIRNVLWVGKTLLTNTYTHNSGSNRPNLASGKVPLTYNAILKGGFESDIIVSFQSKPICSIFNIADELKRVTQFKVNFENYQKTPQQNFAVNDYAQEIVNASPDIPASFINGNFSTTNSNFPFNQDPITYYKSFDNIAFGIPNTNPNEYFYIRKQIQKPTSPYNYSSHEDFSLVKNIQEISPTFAYYSASAGRVYPDFGVPDRFKSCLLINGGEDVWATGNEITIFDNVNTFYSIYMEEIKDEKQTAGQSLIRIATTLQNANDGIYIPNAGSTGTYNSSLTVKFLSTHKDFSKLDAPRYDGFNPNSLSTANQNANDRGITYSVTGSFTTPVTQEINIRMNPAIQVPSGGHYFLPSTYPLINFGLLMNYQAYGNTSTKPNYADPTAPLSTYIDNQFLFYDRLEVISLSPLKLKYVNMKFFYNDSIDVKQYSLQYTPPNLTLINANGYCFWGFQCDVIMEEVVDEFIEESLPVEFNQILENVEYIQTSNLMNSRTPMQMINPEQCEHIGKVIDRKDCNCPKKWVRLCDVHGKTDWKKCMQCKDFKVSE